MQKGQVVTNLRQLLKFLEKYKYFADFYAMDLLTTNYYKSIPLDYTFLETIDIPDLCRIVSDGYYNNQWSFKEYIKESQLHNLDRSCHLNPIAILKPLSIGMNTKKVKETSLIALEIYKVCKAIADAHVLDFGCGQGYLSTVLAYQFGLHVVGVDADLLQIHGALRRQDRILSLLQNSTDSTDSIGTLKFIHKKIEWSDGIDAVIDQIDKSDGTHSWVVCGLHTCGNLAPIMIRGFVESQRAKALVSIGCCYQLLTEQGVHHCVTGNQSLNESTQNDLKVKEDQSLNELTQNNAGCFGFPLSSVLQGHCLGANARMVACSASKRWDPSTISESLKRLYYRCVFQKILYDFGVTIGNQVVKKLGKNQCTDPVTYTRAALARINSGVCITDDQIREYYDTFSFVQNQIKVCWTLRSLLAESIESVLLLDRVLFGIEHGIDTRIVAVVDPKDSPRNMAIIMTRTDAMAS